MIDVCAINVNGFDCSLFSLGWDRRSGGLNSFDIFFLVGIWKGIKKKRCQ